MLRCHLSLVGDADIDGVAAVVTDVVTAPTNGSKLRYQNDCEMNGEAKRRLVRRSSYPRSAGWCITSLTRSSSQCSFVLDSLKHTCTGEKTPCQMAAK